MSKTLRQILEKYVPSKLSDQSKAEQETIISALEIEIAKEIISEKSDELTSLQIKKLQEERKKMAAERLHNSIEQIKSVLVTGCLIGILIGLLVNQATDLISLGKGVSPDMPFTGTVGIIILLLLAIIIVIYILYRYTVARIVEKYLKKDEIE